MKTEVKQKLLGITLAVLSVLLTAGTGELSFCVLFVPLGLYITFTKEDYM